jgi:SpoIIAA-like
MEQIIAEHGSARILLFMDEGFEAGAAWEDLKYGFSRLKTAAKGKFEKVAIVGGSEWLRRLARSSVT